MGSTDHLEDGVADDDKQTRDGFHEAVNMTAKQLEDFLDTDESKSVGQKSGGSGSRPDTSPGAGSWSCCTRRWPT
ncbi:DUF3140 domain-containing protein [Klenkia terrae]|uniref:DUF3140 domain-containing protein n=1 Tax=Klenkia terrae TaxID=1052259 RepID=UPI003616A1D4